MSDHDQSLRNLLLFYKVSMLKYILGTRAEPIYQYTDMFRYGHCQFAYRYAWCHIAILSEIILAKHLVICDLKICTGTFHSYNINVCNLNQDQKEK